MNVLSLISGALKLANWFAEYAERQGLLNQGERNAIGKATSEALKNVAKAKAARRAVKHDAVSVSDDPDNRDG